MITSGFQISCAIEDPGKVSFGSLQAQWMCGSFPQPETFKVHCKFGQNKCCYDETVMKFWQNYQLLGKNLSTTTIYFFVFTELMWSAPSDWLYTCIAHRSILSNAHGAWLIFWSVLRRCKVTSWDETGQCCHWRIIPISPFENFGACWFLYVSTILWLTHRDCRILI
jgi:hypothetical protein